MQIQQKVTNIKEVVQIISKQILAKGENSLSNTLKCPVCNKSFEEIANDGKMGCAECYAVFYDKLLPSLNRIHGKASYVGIRPQKNGTYSDIEISISVLKKALETAVNEQNFELAAQLRDEINLLLGEGGRNP